MNPDSFHTVREAKEFLASRIAGEAAREGFPLSDVERKMLFFSETGWTLPDMAKVNEEFDEKYDQTGFEAKIARLIRNARKHSRTEGPEEYAKWSAAVQKLEKGDHYILVMTDRAGLRRHKTPLLSTRTKIVLIAVGAVALISDWILDFHFHALQHRGGPIGPSGIYTDYPIADKVIGPIAAIAAIGSLIWLWLVYLDPNVWNDVRRILRGVVKRSTPPDSRNAPD